LFVLFCFYLQRANNSSWSTAEKAVILNNAKRSTTAAAAHGLFPTTTRTMQATAKHLDGQPADNSTRQMTNPHNSASVDYHSIDTIGHQTDKGFENGARNVKKPVDSASGGNLNINITGYHVNNYSFQNGTKHLNKTGGVTSSAQDDSPKSNFTHSSAIKANHIHAYNHTMKVSKADGYKVNVEAQYHKKGNNTEQGTTVQTEGIVPSARQNYPNIRNRQPKNHIRINVTALPDLQSHTALQPEVRNPAPLQHLQPTTKETVNDNAENYMDNVHNKRQPMQEFWNQSDSTTGTGDDNRRQMTVRRLQQACKKYIGNKEQTGESRDQDQQVRDLARRVKWTRQLEGNFFVAPKQRLLYCAVEKVCMQWLAET
jgi:hypothetical protein